MTHILVVDEDAHFRTTMIRALKSADYRATGLQNADSLPSALAIHKPDLVLLDLTSDGLDACRGLRSWSEVPVIMVSVSQDEKHKVIALDAGADDYLVKPFGIDELLARIRAIQRRLERAASQNAPIRQFGDLTIDLASSLVILGNEPLHLTRNEHKLLRALVQAEGRPVPYRELLAAVYGREGQAHGERSMIRTLVKQLRRKLNEDLSNPRYVVTESGLGYRFNIQPIVAAEDYKTW